MRQMVRLFGSLMFAAVIACGGFATVAAAETPDKTIGLDDRLTPRSLGRDDAPVTLVEFSSLTCPHCASFHSETLPKIKDAYVTPGKVRYVYHDFPLDNLAMAAAMLSRCVDRERYFGFMETLFANQARWAGSRSPVQDLEKLSRLAGMSKETFDACLADQELLDGIRSAAQEAAEEYDIDSTPTFLVNGDKITGAVDFATMQQRIDAALEASGASGAAGRGVAD
ncbi:MAG: DsbA family protein [Rhodospirillales bacterium]|nr:DsbA family protein [Rhodospirillales bacterium]